MNSNNYIEYQKYKNMYIDLKNQVNMFGRGKNQPIDYEYLHNKNNPTSGQLYDIDAICSTDVVDDVAEFEYPLFRTNAESEYQRCNTLFKRFISAMQKEKNSLDTQITIAKRDKMEYKEYGHLIQQSDFINNSLKSAILFVNDLNSYKHLMNTLNDHLNSYRLHITGYNKIDYIEHYFGQYDPILGYTPTMGTKPVKGVHTYSCIFNYLNKLSPEMVYNFLSMPLFVKLNKTVYFDTDNQQLSIKFPENPDELSEIEQFKHNFNELYAFRETRFDMLLYLNSFQSTDDRVITSKMHNDNFKNLFYRFDTHNQTHVQYLIDMFNQPSVYVYRYLLGIQNGRMSQLLLIGMFELYIHLLFANCQVNTSIDYFIILKILSSERFLELNKRSTENINMASNIRDILADKLPPEYKVGTSSKLDDIIRLLPSLIRREYIDIINSTFGLINYNLTDDIIDETLSYNLNSGPPGIGEMER